jgi:hypothetical protein
MQPGIASGIASLFSCQKSQPEIKSVMPYKVEIRIVKINQETNVEQLGESFFAGELDFKQAEECIKEVKPKLEAIRDDWLAKDIE